MNDPHYLPRDYTMEQPEDMVPVRERAAKAARDEVAEAVERLRNAQSTYVRESGEEDGHPEISAAIHFLQNESAWAHL